MLELLVLAIAPALFIFLYIYRKDCYEPEPLHLVLWVFFLGALAVIPAGILELPFPDGLVTSSIAAPVIEETLKFLVVFVAVYRHPEFDEPMDGIVYAMAAGLGFATVENILYVLEGGVAVGIVRAVASVPGHVIFSCIWGFALGTAKFRPASGRKWIILPALSMAMLLHGIFNFSLGYWEGWGLLLILVVIVPFGWWMTCRNIRSAHADPSSACSAMKSVPIVDQHILPNPASLPLYSKTGQETASRSHFCTNCGTYVREGTRFCEQCGKEF